MAMRGMDGSVRNRFAIAAPKKKVKHEKMRWKVFGKKKEMRQSISCGSCVQWMKRRVLTWLQIRMVAHHPPVD